MPLRDRRTLQTGRVQQRGFIEDAPIPGEPLWAKRAPAPSGASAWMPLKAGAQRLEQGRRCIEEVERVPPQLGLSFQITSALT